MSERYECGDAAGVEVTAERASEVVEDLDDYAIVIGDPYATAYVVRGTVADLARFATAVTQALTMAALGAEGRMPRLVMPSRPRS